jgi:succinate dehydrogenase/fumarate reductase flavoprotein subunit
LLIIGGGVAGYVAAIKAGQEGMKVRRHYPKWLSNLANENSR